MLSVDAKTPTVRVLDNRGLTVRNIAYHRHPDTPDVINERITRHQYDARGALTLSAGPRLHQSGLADITYLSGLTGDTLRTRGADNGTVVTLSDAAGRPLLTVTAGGVVQRVQYEPADLPGRALSITEQAPGSAARVTDRFVYAGNSDAEKALNLAGVCLSHYDTAGLQQTDSISLTGIPLSVTRQLMKDADNPEALADWQGADSSTWNDQLDTEGLITLTTPDTTGATLTITDTKGNRQRVAYDVAGQLKGSWLTLKGGAEQVIVASLTWSAAGQKLREEHGNGVVTTYTYEPETQRLTGIKTERPAGHASGAKVLQDLRYEYDPVGNVLAIRNDAEETRFWRNQKVVPEQTYTYDSLYQLVSATGREMASAGQQGSSLPDIASIDSVTLTNYTRTYDYDDAGNLTRIRHSAPATGNNYTTDITVSDRSNRAVLSTLTDIPSEVDSLFTAGGQQRQLLPGQDLIWTARNELLKVTPVVREGSTDDRESYRYDSQSQRLLKVSVQKTGNNLLTQRALYLPGLELRSTTAGTTETETLQVITVGEAGSAQVRVMVWTAGKPADITDQQVRYSHDTLTGSSGLEVDGEGRVISMEEYYPYGGTAVWTVRSAVEAEYKTVRYSGKERDATGLYYYGYRYYQPWAGRWLSSDPAGTVDGLNLFRMCRNNPVTLRDSDGRKPVLFTDSFNHERGDLVFGLAKKTESVFDSPGWFGMTRNTKPEFSSFIDHYAFLVRNANYISVLRAVVKGANEESPRKLKPEKALDILSTNINDIPNEEQREFYRRFIVGYFGSDNFSWFRTAQENRLKDFHFDPDFSKTDLLGAMAGDYQSNTLERAQTIASKRMSKAAIETVLTKTGGQIHFILDDIDLTGVVVKSNPVQLNEARKKLEAEGISPETVLNTDAMKGGSGNSITASELRYIFRNREKAVNKVFFYKNGMQVAAPWVNNPKLWGLYNPKSKS